MIRTSHLMREFRDGDGGNFYAVNDVSIRIPEGKLTILRGRSGSGKTTLMNLLGTLDEPSAGEIWFGDEPLSRMTPAQRERFRRYQVGFVFQSVALIPVMSAYENVDFALRLAGYEGDRDERIREVMDRVGLLKRMHHMPGQLSGGEQQRTAIARAAVHRPAVIFADEPTAALDTASGLAVMALFRGLVDREHITIVMSTHDQGLMEQGDIVYELSDGKIENGEV